MILKVLFGKAEEAVILGLVRENIKTGEITTFKHDPLDKASLSSDRVYSIYRGQSKNLWIGTYGGLDILNEETGKFTHLTILLLLETILLNNWVGPFLSRQ